MAAISLYNDRHCLERRGQGVLRRLRLTHQGSRPGTMLLLQRSNLSSQLRIVPLPRREHVQALSQQRLHLGLGGAQLGQDRGQAASGRQVGTDMNGKSVPPYLSLEKDRCSRPLVSERSSDGAAAGTKS